MSSLCVRWSYFKLKSTGFPPERNKIVLHSTINRTRKPTEFIEEINDFLDEWEAGLISQF